MEEIKGFHKNFVILSVFYVIAGVVLLFWPEMSIELFCKVLGIGMLIAGLTHIIIYFTKDHMMNIMQMDLVIGVLCVSFGAFLLLHPDFVQNALPFVVGVLFMMGGIVKLQNAIDMRRLHFRFWKVVLFFAIVMLILGAVLIYNPFSSDILTLYIGISLILEGVLNVICILCIAYLFKKVSRVKNAAADSGGYGGVQQIVDIPEQVSGAKAGKQELEIRT